MNVPMLDPQRGNAEILNELEAAVLKVIRSGKYILGEEVEKFEKTCAEYLGCSDTIAVSSGTDALLLSLMTLGIGPGDEVICPSFTFFATAGAVSRVGAVPVFVDIYPNCFTLDIDSVRNAITANTKAIIPVHLFGQSADMLPLIQLAEQYKLFIIEDACQAIGTEYMNKKVGTLGTTGCFSFFPSKNLGGFGDAGLVSTNDPVLAKELRSMRVHGGKQQYIHERVGGNFRIDALQAALLNVKLKYLPEAELARKRHAALYIAALDKCTNFTIPLLQRGKHVWNQFTLRVHNEQRDSLQFFLRNKGIASAIYYPLPLHKQTCFQDVVPQDCFFPETDRAAQEVLSVPIASEITDEELFYVIEALSEFDETP